MKIEDVLNLKRQCNFTTLSAVVIYNRRAFLTGAGSDRFNTFATTTAQVNCGLPKFIS